ncbi:MAG: peptide ABC transporter substrate-binding protein [Candidatus Latescibacteria bacterium]|nr:peptide ABC transporter substrate-binding protein [Candidatus Latescibacterota bacterium]
MSLIKCVPVLFFIGMAIFLTFSSQQASAPIVNTVGKTMPSDAAPLAQQVLRMLHEEPTTLDISIAVYKAKGAVFTFEGLTRLDHNNELTPAAAERWDVSPDGKKWTFYLRKGALWSDGRPVTAHDFEYTFKRLLDPNSGNTTAVFYYEIKGAKAFNQGKSTDSNTVGVKAVDNYTFVVETESPCPYFPLIASFPTSGPVPRWQVEKYGPKWTEEGKCVSNATFKLTEWRQGSHYEFTLDPNYNGPHKAFIERVVGKFSNLTMMPGNTLAYENNEIDFQNITPGDVARIKKDSQLMKELDISAGFQTHYLYFDTRTAPFNNLKVRQAFAHAIDRDILCRILLQGIGQPAYSMLPPGFPGHAGGKFKDTQRFDPAMAKSLLMEAGYPNGRGFPRYELWINSVNNRNVALYIQQNLKQNLNVDITIKVVESRAYRQAMFQWKIPMSLIQYNYDYPDPNNMLSMVWHFQPVGYGRHPWKNETFDQLVDKAAGEMNPARRSDLYDQAQQILSGNVGAVFLYYAKMASLRKPWIKGIKQSNNGDYPYWGNNTSHMDMYIGRR